MNVNRLYSRRSLFIYTPLALLTLVLFYALSARWMPLPPQTLKISSGNQGAGYYLNAQRYAQALKKYGIELEVLESVGTGQNIERLQDDQAGVQMAFVQGGYASSEYSAALTSRIETVGQMWVEPVWIFSRFSDLTELSSLQGKRLAIGQTGSGTRVVALQILNQLRLETKDFVISEISAAAAVQGLKQNKIDALILVAGVESPILQKLLSDKDIHLAKLRRSAALSERMSFLKGRFLPANSLGQQTPAQDMTLLSTQAALVVRKDLHPMTKRFIAAASLELHSGAGLLHRAGEYPNLKQIEFPSARESRQVLSSGLPWAEQHLSGLWAQWLYRILMIGLPLFVLLVLGLKLIKRYLEWRIESDINRWYGELKFIENDLDQHHAQGLEMSKLWKKFKKMEAQISQFNAPAIYTQRLYLLRKHVQYVKLFLNSRRAP